VVYLNNLELNKTEVIVAVSDCISYIETINSSLSLYMDCSLLAMHHSVREKDL
jgi:hypothetical protein